MSEFKSPEAVTSILSGIEAMHIMKKAQRHQHVKFAQNKVGFIHKLFGIAL